MGAGRCGRAHGLAGPRRDDRVLGRWLHLDGGTLDLGVVRDATLNNTNACETFAKSFDAVARIGNDSVLLDLDVCPSGKSSAPVSIDPYTSGS
jgi:hypothetical protein